jgi:DNA polymerase/3'-5' exonuclease PolX
MNRDQGMTLEYTREIAEALVELLTPACQRIEIAGSIRRKKLYPNDIEVVAIPKWLYSEDHHEIGARTNEFDLLRDELLT